ncbi:MAG: hypothetical protein IJW13_00900 [Clostridia bacterium]|nr:hypothetical protein [Clostridia bacterium]
MLNEENSKVERVIQTATEKMKEFGGGQVVGEPIMNEMGQTVIPVSDMTIAVFSGGGDYGEVKLSDGVGENFAGGSAIICSLKPNCFITNNGNGYFISKPNNLIDNLSSLAELITKALKK